MAQHAAPNLHQEMFVNAVAALLVALARLPARMRDQPNKDRRQAVQDADRTERHVRRVKP